MEETRTRNRRSRRTCSWTRRSCTSSLGALLRYWRSPCCKQAAPSTGLRGDERRRYHSLSLNTPLFFLCNFFSSLFLLVSRNYLSLFLFVLCASNYFFTTVVVLCCVVRSRTVLVLSLWSIQPTGDSSPLASCYTNYLFPRCFCTIDSYVVYLEEQRSYEVMWYSLELFEARRFLWEPKLVFSLTIHFSCDW